MPPPLVGVESTASTDLIRLVYRRLTNSDTISPSEIEKSSESTTTTPLKVPLSQTMTYEVPMSEVGRFQLQSWSKNSEEGARPSPEVKGTLRIGSVKSVHLVLPDRCALLS